ncbi:hypothetical protein B484DRAFT_422041 [Ochromonadaceae sp. CCMP2298]|nr:hypothetical protein B484DRAFT_422041 [Ochromonadaceae sp. CCMP2298]
MISSRFHAAFSAWLSILVGLTIAVLAVLAGQEEGSMALIGVAFMGIVDITGSVMVLLIYGTIHAHAKDDRKEAQYSLVIGVLMLGLGVFLATDSTFSLLDGTDRSLSKRRANARNSLGFDIAIFGAAASLALAFYKYLVSRRLGSAVIFTDALSSLCTGLASLASMLISSHPTLPWWSDGVSGLAVAVFILYSSAFTMVASGIVISRTAPSPTGEKLTLLRTLGSYPPPPLPLPLPLPPRTQGDGFDQEFGEYDDDYEVSWESSYTFRRPFIGSMFSIPGIPALDSTLSGWRAMWGPEAPQTPPPDSRYSSVDSGQHFFD